MTISFEKKLGHNTTFKQGSTTIGGAKTIQPPGYSRDKVDVTTLDSSIADFLPGDPPEIGEVTVSGIWVSGLTAHELLDASVSGKTNDTYSIVYNGWTTVRTATFTAYCINVTPAQIESKNPYMRDITLVPTSTVTWS